MLRAVMIAGRPRAERTTAGLHPSELTTAVPPRMASLAIRVTAMKPATEATAAIWRTDVIRATGPTAPPVPHRALRNRRTPSARRPMTVACACPS